MSSTTPVGATPVTGAIRKAAQATGAGFDYLLATAKIESDLDPNLTMGSSSATGLFQFIDQTWLGTLKQAGPAFGYGNYADAITLTPSGRYVIEDPALRDEIMQLRPGPPPLSPPLPCKARRLPLAPPPLAPAPADIRPTEPVSSPAPMPIVMGYATDTFTPAADPDTSTVLPTRADAGGMFHSLFQTGERREAVSPALRELSTSPGRATAPDAASPPAGASRDKGAGQGFMLGLFRDPGTK